MKKLLLIIGIASLAYSCQKKADNPTTAQAETEIRPQPVAQDTTIGMVKVTVWSNRKNFVYKRRHIYKTSPLTISWRQDSVKTNSKVFYETYYTGKDGIDSHSEYALLASHGTSRIAKDSIRITLDYEGKKATNLNVSGNTFAITHLNELK
jgi:photosystem II stability/assembly factor-like uncharacterized protein